MLLNERLKQSKQINNLMLSMAEQRAPVQSHAKNEHVYEKQTEIRHNTK